MNDVLDAIVIGGGQAGLATGYHLQKKKVNFLILEANEQPTGSWPSYYDSLKLFSPARFSSLPGMKISGGGDRYLLRDEVIGYLQDYARHFQLPVVTRQRVEFVEKDGNGFTIRTESGDIYRAKTIVNATGSFHNPFTPAIRGKEEYQGDILHSSAYRNPEKFIEQRVIVVGRGNSAVQIAIELAKVSRVSLAVLQPVQLINQRIWGQDLHFWIKVVGLDTFPFWRFGKKAPLSKSVIDLGDYKRQLAAGDPDQKPMFTSFYRDGVIWPDGTKESINSVIFATGYRPDLSYLYSTGALDSDGKPLQTAGISICVPGLYYVGLEGQRSFASATLRGVGPDAKFVVRNLMRFLKK